MKDHNLSSKFPFLLQKLFIYLLFTLQRKTQNLSFFFFLSIFPQSEHKLNGPLVIVQ